MHDVASKICAVLPGAQAAAVRVALAVVDGAAEHCQILALRRIVDQRLPVPRQVQPLVRGLHSSPFQLNLSHF